MVLTSKERWQRYREKNPELVRESQRKRDTRRRLEKLEYALRALGGVCQECGATESPGKRKALEFHHKVPSEKSFSIGGGNFTYEQIDEELKKCRLLCKPCHDAEHAKSGS